MLELRERSPIGLLHSISMRSLRMWGWGWPCFDTNLFSLLKEIILYKYLIAYEQNDCNQCLLQPHFHLMKINIIRGSMEMRIIYCQGFRSTLCWLHDIDWIAFWRALSLNVAVSFAFVATNWNGKIIYIYFYMKTKLWCIMLLHQGPANTIAIKHLVRE